MIHKFDLPHKAYLVSDISIIDVIGSGEDGTNSFWNYSISNSISRNDESVIGTLGGFGSGVGINSVGESGISNIGGRGSNICINRAGVINSNYIEGGDNKATTYRGLYDSRTSVNNLLRGNEAHISKHVWK